MHCCPRRFVAFVVPLLVLGAGVDKSLAGDLESFLTATISRLEMEMQVAPATEHPAFEATIESLRRLRDRHEWPIINHPVKSAELRGTTWMGPIDENRFQQRIQFSAGGTGSWHRDAVSHSMSFSWHLESDRLRLTFYRDYGKSFNYEIIDRTYRYERLDDHLTLVRDGEKLEWNLARTD